MRVIINFYNFEYYFQDPPAKIVKKWRSKEWPEGKPLLYNPNSSSICTLTGHHSVVTIEIVQKEDCTDLSLVQTGIPSSDHERIKDGWKRRIFEPIKSTFGYGVRIF